MNVRSLNIWSLFPNRRQLKFFCKNVSLYNIEQIGGVSHEKIA